MTVKFLSLSVPWNSYVEFHICVRFPATWNEFFCMSSNNYSISMHWLQIMVPWTGSLQEVLDLLEMAIKIILVTSNGHLDRPEDLCLWLLFDTVHEFSQIRNGVCNIFQWSLNQGSMNYSFGNSLPYFRKPGPWIPNLHLNSISRMNLKHSSFCFFLIFSYQVTLK